MNTAFSNIVGQKEIIESLQKTIDNNRISHSQLFIGKQGVGTLPMAVAYANAVLLSRYTQEDKIKSCKERLNKLTHPDLHFVFPTAKTTKIKNPISDLFLEDWRIFLRKNTYGSLLDWYEHICIENVQGQINVDDVKRLIDISSLKSFEGGYKVIIVWMAEKINLVASNKLLKIIEEPTPKTLFIFVTENENNIIPTLRSRLQSVYFKPIPQQLISKKLSDEYNLDLNSSTHIAHQSEGNWNKAMKLLDVNAINGEFEDLFITMVRSAIKTDIYALITLTNKICDYNREVIKSFLSFCIEVFRQAMLNNYNVKDFVLIRLERKSFNFSNFCKFITSDNIEDFLKYFSESIYHIERNANPKIVFLDTAIRVTRLLHKGNK
ncbi:DNA polymerase III subunit [Ichthyobacterium seriolicida]|uniref:DNA polymerase III delta prime subunit n=1 Tax=Ichthyobacterium seriolicida TaxID=242600 RepID=A0A1J1DWH7_9FLAO|nr:DNA polymerase III subunit delta' [Ichthyobacterium seriolicida]BAV94223.1 DNA polymerase III delta prime subunit [Ichthyobacterium seriolicida]